MAYIYHIYSTEDPSTVYVGQCLDDRLDTTPVYEKETASGTRPLQHFSGLYSNRVENSKWREWLRLHPLSTIKIDVFPGPYYGLDQATLDSFFAFWKPRGFVGNVSFEYDEAMHFQTADVKNKGTIEHKVMANIIDAAEIIHIYNMRRQGKQLLNQSMGGQSYFIGQNSSIVINNTMSIEQMMQLVKTSPQNMDKIQKQFNKELYKLWNHHKLSKSYIIHGNTFSSGQTFVEILKNLLLNKIVEKTVLSKKRKSQSTKADVAAFKDELKEVLKIFLQDSFPLIIKNLNSKFKEQEVLITIGPLLKNLYSATKNIFETVKQYNILTILTNIFSSKDYWQKHLKNAQTGKQTLQKYIQDNIDQIVSELISKIEQAHISVSNFITITNKNETNSWYFLNVDVFNNPIHAQQEYHKSLKKMSYFYFTKHIAAEALKQDSGVTYPRFVTYDEDRYCIASGFKWSMAIKSILRSMKLLFMNDTFIDNYCAQMLTIYAQHQPEKTPHKKLMSLKEVPGNTTQGVFKLGVFDIPGFERTGVFDKSAAPKNDYWDSDRVWYYIPAYQFSDETYSKISQWIENTDLDNIIYY